MDNKRKGHAGQRNMCEGPERKNSKALSGQEEKGPNEGAWLEWESQTCGLPKIARTKQDVRS